MTPQEALQVLDAMCARTHGTRGDHALVQEALLVLSALVDDESAKAAPGDRLSPE